MALRNVSKQTGLLDVTRLGHASTLKNGTFDEDAIKYSEEQVEPRTDDDDDNDDDALLSFKRVNNSGHDCEAT